MTKILFMGRKYVSAEILKVLHNNNKVKVVGVLTDSHLKNSPTAKVANELGYKLYEFESARNAIKNNEITFDLGVSVLYWKKLDDIFLSVPKKNIINFHPALLPKYKGCAGYNMAILDSLSEWGISAHYVDNEIDTGAIIEVLKFNFLAEYETAQTLEKLTMSFMYNFVVEIINKAVSKSGLLDTSPNIGGNYISRNEMNLMKKVVEGDDIDKKIRAFWFPPYQGAYKLINGKKYTLINDFVLKQLSPPNSTNLFVENVD